MKSKNSFILTTLGAAVFLLAGCEDDKMTTPQTTFVQVDRMAIPAVNTALIPSASKDAFNQADPKNDAANYRATAQASITGLRAAVNAVPGFPPEDGGADSIPPATLAAILIPDVVTIDFSQPVAFPNGRRLQDDVVDAAVGLVLNRGMVLQGGGGVSDAIAANDQPFLSAFPYLAAPNLPLARPTGK